MNRNVKRQKNKKQKKEKEKRKAIEKVKKLFFVVERASFPSSSLHTHDLRARNQ